MDKKQDSMPEEMRKTAARLPGADIAQRIDAWWGLLLGVILLALLLVVLRPYPYLNMVKFFGDGVVVTIYVTVLSFAFTLVAGLIGGLGRLSKNRIIYGISTAYVEVIRGIPLLVQLIWWYFAFPVVIQAIGRAIGSQALASYQANAILMAIIGLTFCYGAYMSEIYRAGIQSIQRGQAEAAYSLGMNYFQSMRFIVLPQAVRVILPPVGNEFIALLKDSSLVSVVAVADLTRRGREFSSQSFLPLQTWTMVALIYLMMTLFSARIAFWIEKKTRTAER